MESSDDPCIDKDGEDKPKTAPSDEDYCDYADVSHEEVCRRFESSSGCSSSSSSIGAARQPNPHAPGSQQQGFAVKLHSMISDIEASGDSSIVSWQPHGRCVLLTNSRGLLQKTYLSPPFAHKKLICIAVMFTADFSDVLWYTIAKHS